MTFGSNQVVAKGRTLKINGEAINDDESTVQSGKNPLDYIKLILKITIEKTIVCFLRNNCREKRRIHVPKIRWRESEMEWRFDERFRYNSRAIHQESKRSLRQLQSGEGQRFPTNRWLDHSDFVHFCKQLANRHRSKFWVKQIRLKTHLVLIKKPNQKSVPRLQQSKIHATRKS